VPLIPIVAGAGAGGIVSTWENGRAQAGGHIVVAGDARVHQAAMEMLKG
jgi:myo-inositol-1(or 4)-monophosphatase